MQYTAVQLRTLVYHRIPGNQHVLTLFARHRLLLAAAVVVVFSLIMPHAARAQRSGEDDMRVTLALQKYQLATLKMDTPTLVALFTPVPVRCSRSNPAARW